MKRRELVIISAVLVPFALLVAAGFYFAPDAPNALPLPSGEGRAEGTSIADASVPDPRPHPDPLPRGEGTTAPPPVVDSTPPELRPLMPEVKRCFADQRLKARHEVKVRFTPTRDGGFKDVQVDEQNPYLAACLEDVFAELGWQPDGGETFAPATHTFSFDPSPD